jgi:hypothetical protein
MTDTRDVVDRRNIRSIPPGTTPEVRQKIIDGIFDDIPPGPEVRNPIPWAEIPPAIIRKIEEEEENRRRHEQPRVPQQQPLDEYVPPKDDSGNEQTRSFAGVADISPLFEASPDQMDGMFFADETNAPVIAGASCSLEINQRPPLSAFMPLVR